MAPKEQLVPMERRGKGYYQAVVEGVGPGSLYRYRLDEEKERPDPASRFQPEGVHGPSQVVDPHVAWEDHGWFGLPIQDYIRYELHLGTFTPEGTFDAIVPYLDGLKDLGVTVIELMPVAQFPGSRNWGYEGVYPFTVQNSYGGPEGLKRLVNASHQKGLAVVLDVVYNHPGPEGNYLGDFGPYLTDQYRTPWGLAFNFDGPWSDEVRRFFIENALFWITEFHVDALRLDAVHAIFDHSPQPFLEELALVIEEQTERLNRRVDLVPESAANDARLIRPRELGGFGLDAQWNDDFHHALHTLLTGERGGYYQDFGKLQHLVKAFREGFVYSGEYPLYRRRRHGTASKALPARRFVVFAQNHDQVGNRMRGEHLSRLVSFEALKLAAGVVLLSPFLPLLFMGEEYGETAPFQYFVSHSAPALVPYLHELGMPDLYDIVPNPMGIDESNRWWQDVLENGPGSSFAKFFDIDWSPPKEDLVNTVLLPVLGDQFGKVLENGELRLLYEGGTFFIAYHDQRFPVAPRTRTAVLNPVLEKVRHILKKEPERVRERH